MSLLKRVEVTPYYAQIELSAPDCSDYPQWETGEEAVVALPDCIAVGTQGDDQGKVMVEVWYGSLEADDPDLGPVLFDGKFVTPENSVVIGNTVGNEFYSVPTPSNRFRVKVFTSPLGGRAKKVYFLLMATRRPGKGPKGSKPTVVAKRRR